MKNYNKKIMESFIIKEQKENEVSLKELLEYRFLQYKNMTIKMNILNKKLEERFNKEFKIMFNAEINLSHFSIQQKNWSGAEMRRIKIENNSLEFMCDEDYSQLINFINANAEFFCELYALPSENNILENSNFVTHDSTNQYAVFSRGSNVHLGFNYQNIDLTESEKLNCLSFATPFAFGVDCVNQKDHTFKIGEQSYYWWRDNIIQKLILKYMLSKENYKDKKINPLEAIMIYENNLPSDIVKHVKQKRKSINT